MYAQVTMFYSTQSICVVKYPMKKFKTEILNRPKLQSGKLSEIAEEVGASFAVNAGYFHMNGIYPSYRTLSCGWPCGHQGSQRQICKD